jgi:hypothetical protein
MHQPPPTNNNRSTPAQFRSKLGTYLTGILIGFMILGSIYYQKYLATQRLEAQAQADAQVGQQSTPPATDAKP